MNSEQVRVQLESMFSQLSIDIHEIVRSAVDDEISQAISNIADTVADSVQGEIENMLDISEFDIPEIIPTPSTISGTLLINFHVPTMVVASYVNEDKQFGNSLNPDNVKTWEDFLMFTHHATNTNLPFATVMANVQTLHGLIERLNAEMKTKYAYDADLKSVR
jgi:hypothetical protein